MQRLMPILVGLLIVLAALSSCVFVVRERDYALVFSLGEVRKVISEPGLYFKAPPPFQNVVTLDKRILTIETNDAERIQTSEKKNLLIDSYVKWRIADPRLYYVTFGGNERAAQERLQAQIRDALNASVNVRTVRDVVSSERDKVMAEILTNVAKRAEPLGVQVVDVRLRRIEFAPEISESVYRRMEAERTRVANELRSIGAAEGERSAPKPTASARSSWPKPMPRRRASWARAMPRRHRSMHRPMAEPAVLHVLQEPGSLPRFVLEAGRRAGGRPQLQLLPVHEGSGRGPGAGDRAGQVSPHGPGRKSPLARQGAFAAARADRVGNRGRLEPRCGAAGARR